MENLLKMKRINTHHYISSSSSSPFYRVYFASAGTNNCFASGRPANNQYQQHQHKIIVHHMNIINVRRRSHELSLSSNMILLFLRFSVITMMMCIRLVSTQYELWQRRKAGLRLLIPFSSQMIYYQ